MIRGSASEMADSFDEAVVYSLGCIGKADLILKEEQKKVVRHIFDGDDTFVWLPTGFGKSICYECLPFLFDFTLGRTQSSGIKSLVIVISPLISLMIDQVISLRKRGVLAAILSGHDGIDRALLASDNDLGLPGKYSLLFTAPEAIIGSAKWREKLLMSPLNDRVVAVAVDEAHCVSKW